MSNFNSVKKFMVTAGQCVETIPQTNICSTEKGVKVAVFRYDLISEEFKELQKAISENDFKEVVDALGDLLYVIYGAGHTFGVDLDKEYDKVFVSKLKELKFEESNIVAGKNTNFEKALLTMQLQKREVNTTPQKDMKNMELYAGYVDNMNILLTALLKSIQRNNFEDIVGVLSNFLYVVYEMGHFVGVNLDKAFDIVHSSNMTKFCKSEEEAKKTVNNYKSKYEQKQSPYDSPTFRFISLKDNEQKGEEYYVVYNKSTSKVLKNINYTPVDFSTLF